MTTQTMQEVIENYGEWAHAGEPEQTAAEWEGYGFTPAEAAAWLDARCWDPRSAQDLDAEGMTPAMAAIKVGEDAGSGGYVDTIGYKVANDDLGARLAVHLAKEAE